MERILLLDGWRGIYLPKDFAVAFPEAIPDDETREILLSGPEHEFYWDVWDEVLDTAEIVGRSGQHYRLEMDDGDLFAVPV